MKRIFLLLFLTCFFSSGCVLIYSNFDFFSELGPLEETTLMGKGKDRILLMDISGEISNQEMTSMLGFSADESMVSLIHEQLNAAEKNKHIKAVIVRINSPGGTVTASDIIYNQIKTFRESSQIPIYAMMMDVAASGGYYIAMSADKVFANPTTVTGSIGVIMLNISIQGLMKKIGVKSKVIKSGKNKDIGSPFKDLTPEERKILQSIIDGLYSTFVEVVEKGRPKLSKKQVLKAADGRIYTAQQAEKLGLIDGVGYLPEIINKIKMDLKLRDARVVTYHRPHHQVSNIYSKLQAPTPKGISLIDPELLKPLTRTKTLPGFYYLWDPGLF